MAGHFKNDYGRGTEVYFTNLKPYMPINREEEAVMMQKIKKGDLKERNRLVESHLKYVVLEAKKFKGMGMPFDDLIMEGNLGLMKAIDRYKDTGFKFICYAKWWIKASIQKALRKQGMMVDKMHQIGTQDDEKDAADTGEDELPGVGVKKINSVAVPTLEYDFDAIADGGASTVDKDKIERLMEVLEEREKSIIRFYYNLGSSSGEVRTLEDVSEEFGLSKMRLSKIITKAISKMRMQAVLVD